MTPLEEAIDIANRLTHFGFHKSMRSLRKDIRKVLKGKKLDHHMKDFKLKSDGKYGVSIFVRPGLTPEIKDYSHD